MVCKKEELKLTTLDLNNINLAKKLQKRCDDRVWKKESLIHLLKEGSGFGFVLSEGFTGIGYILARSLQSELEILSFGVLSSYRRMGFGSILFKEIEKFIIINKKSKLILEVNSNNKKAKNFYKSMGLDEIKVLSKYYKTDNGREDGLLMSKFYF
tara:strand:+ start:598 stop:1062 length:465 start_codon:yes stop_codon:yes gene_type:complete